jgi:hypothetical protein
VTLNGETQNIEVYFQADTNANNIVVQGVGAASYTFDVDNIVIKQTGIGWSKGTGWSVANGLATHAGGSSNTYLNQTNSTTVGKIYKAVFTLSGSLNATNYIQVYGVNPYGGFSNQYTSAGTYTLYFTADATFFRFRAVSPDNDVSVDDVSVKEVGQYWQLQYTGTGDWSITDKLNFENVNGGSAQLNVFEVGKFYKITVDYVFTSGTRLILPYDGSNFPTDGVITTTGSVNGYTYYYTPNSATLLIYSDGNGNGSIDNVSVKEVGQDWILGGSGSNIPTIGTNNVAINSVDGNSYIQQSGILTSGKHYKITYDVISASATSNVLKLASSFGMGSIPTSVGTQIVYGTAVTSNLYIERYTNGVNATITNISVKEVGQHWTFGTGWSTDGTKAISDGTLTSSDTLLQTFDFVDGATYKFTFTILDYDSGGVYIREPYNGYLDVVSANGTYSFNYVAGSSNNIQFRSDNNFTGSIDNIVVQELKHDATNLMLNAGAYQSANPLITSTKSMDFDGTDDYLQVGDVGSVKSMSFWFNPDNDITASTTQQRMFGFNGSSYDGVLLGAATGLLTGETLTVMESGGNFGRTATTKEFDAGRWYHIVIAWNETITNFDIYVDGVLSTDLIANTFTLANFTDFKIGTSNDLTNKFNGQITEVGNWDRTLTALEVASLYNQGMPTNLLVNRNNYQSGNPTYCIRSSITIQSRYAY